MDKEDAVHLRYIVDAIEQLERYTRGMSESEFFSRPMVQDAVARQIEIVGQAARNVSMEFQGLHPKLPWLKTIDIHSKIVREDFKLNLAMVWDVIQDDLPLVKQTIKKLLQS
ncbi:MAG TPA: HepT-like ribonuclease domain-containing protein [Anaerolineales bacterium]|nr:HepT-like ribonuclease domain-containing protein [Anaerolineales bacterium]